MIPSWWFFATKNNLPHFLREGASASASRHEMLAHCIHLCCVWMLFEMYRTIGHFGRWFEVDVSIFSAHFFRSSDKVKTFKFPMVNFMTFTWNFEVPCAQAQGPEPPPSRQVAWRRRPGIRCKQALRLVVKSHVETRRRSTAPI